MTVPIGPGSFGAPARPPAGQASSIPLDSSLLAGRLAEGGFLSRYDLMRRAGWCERPIRLLGQVHAVDRTSGEVRTGYSSRGEADGLLYIACGNRRASLCRPCSRRYAGDAFQLGAAGVRGGAKGVPSEVSTHPAVFLTLTAPSFGAVHSRLLDKAGHLRPCHPRDRATCPHARTLDCRQRHNVGDPVLGLALCPDCYDAAGARAWNRTAPKLWHYFTTYLPRDLGRPYGLTAAAVRRQLRVEYLKVAELQARGLIHFHALIRVDGPTDRATSPPPWCTAEALAVAATAAARRARAGGHHFGNQLDAHPITGSDSHRVPAYLAKYATKGSAGDFTAVGYPGHFLSKSRAFSTTFGALRGARAAHRRSRTTDPWQRPYDERQVELLPDLAYAGSGHLHPADQALVAAIAADLPVRAALIRDARADRPGSRLPIER